MVWLLNEVLAVFSCLWWLENGDLIVTFTLYFGSVPCKLFSIVVDMSPSIVCEIQYMAISRMIS